MTDTAHCIQCNREVRGRQHAVDCDDCGRWQHRLCDTGISLADYRLAMAGTIDLNFQCNDCKQRIETDMDRQNIAILEELNEENTLTQQDLLDNPENRAEAMDMEAETQSTSASVSLPEGPLNESFDLPHRNADNASEAMEVSMDDPELPGDDDLPTDCEIVYEILPTGTQRGNPLLISSDGFSYVKKSEKNGIVRWRCSVRGRNTTCHVCVTQRDGCFTRNLNQEHHHSVDPKLNVRRKVYSKGYRQRGLIPTSHGNS